MATAPPTQLSLFPMRQPPFKLASCTEWLHFKHLRPPHATACAREIRPFKVKPMQVSIAASWLTAPCAVLKEAQSPSFWVTLLAYVCVFIWYDTSVIVSRDFWINHLSYCVLLIETLCNFELQVNHISSKLFVFLDKMAILMAFHFHFSKDKDLN